MWSFRRFGLKLALAAASFIGGLSTMMVPAQKLDSALVISQVDAAVKARIDNVLSYTVTEHYAVFRNRDETHPVAEMIVKSTYRKDAGKSYEIVSQSGSDIIRAAVIGSILDNEKRLNLPGNREGAWITSANYEMSPRPDANQLLDGRNCLVFKLTPRRSAPFLFDGTLWVDSTDYSIVQFQGMASKSPSLLTGPTQIARQYEKVNGFPMATHARAVSNSALLGQTIVKIDYHDYQLQLRPAE